jgi:hypothetical protein
MVEIQLPKSLVELDKWILWRAEIVQGRATKVPYSVTGHRASTTNPGHWASFEEAHRTWRRAVNQYTGLGFVFAKEDRFVGIDLDDCLQADTVKPWAQGLVERFSDTYMETSPSGRGIKVWARGVLPANLPGVNVGDGQIEMYDHARYFTVTSCVFRGAPLEVEHHEQDVLSLYGRLSQGRRRTWPLQPVEGGRIPYGQQHSTLVSIAGTLRARRVCDEAIEACLQTINERQCEKPGPRENIARIVRSSRNWGARA